MKEAWDNMTNEQLCLEYQATRSDDLFEYFLARNKDLMYSFFGKYIRTFPEQEDDIEQRARLAMWETMCKLDPERGSFSTAFYVYAKKHINHHHEEQYIVRLPRWVFSGGNLERIRNQSSFVTSIRSVDEVIYPSDKVGEEITLLDTLVSPDPTPEEVSFKQAEFDKLMKYVKRLKPREEQVIKKYFGLDGTGRQKTLQEVGDEYNVTRERIRQVLERAIRKLKYYYLKDGGFNNDE